MQSARFQTGRRPPTVADSLSGVVISAMILGLWLVSLLWLCARDVSELQGGWLTLAVLLRTFLHTGVFITAHDAMHGTIVPRHRKLNDLIGSLAAAVYALLPYRRLRAKHWQHHRHPASADDPDFHDGRHSNVLAWYFKFMQGYLDARQRFILLVGMSVLFYGLSLGLHIATANLLWFWILPILLSSVQLFYFGVFLPHRRPVAGYDNCHRASSSGWPVFWSFLSCYNFGYHWEHHEYPDLPWYRLVPLYKRPEPGQSPSENANIGIYPDASRKGKRWHASINAASKT